MMTFKTKIKTLCSVFAMAGALYSCTDVENLEIQEPYTYSDQYYENLRAYKASDHQISFMWFSDYTSSHSPGIRFMGLPDSLDICSLWGGVPNPKDYPLVYEEMRFCQQVKGIKMTYVTFPAVSHLEWVMKHPEEDRVKVYGDSLLRIVYNNGLDGMDLDYEIDGDWMHGANFVKLIEYLGQYIGPKGKDPSKLLIVDGWPINGGYEYLSYFIAQAYHSTGAADLQNRYNQVAAHGLPPERYIVTENMGDYYATGGTPFTEADGNTVSGMGGQLYSLEGMARWNPVQGKKGGFGAFYGQRDYGNTPPYKYFRYGVQVQNPAIQ
jgi:hypothetical protein